MTRTQEWVCSSNCEPKCLMRSEYRYKAPIRSSYKIYRKVYMTQAKTRVKPPDTKTLKPIGKKWERIPQPSAGALTSGG